MKWIAMVIASAVVLAACSASKPSSGEAKDALVKAFAQAGLGVSNIDDFSLESCTKAEGADGVNCDVKGTPVVEFNGRRASGFPIAKAFRFKKVNGTWEVFQ